MNSGLKYSSRAVRSSVSERPSRPHRRDVRGHDQDGVLEVDRAALAVGQAAVVHHLQQRVEDVGVGLLDLVEQHHRVGAAAHRLGQLAALVVADVAGGRADQSRDGVALHVLGHVDADHRVLGVEHELGERARELGLADAGRARGTGRSRSGGRGPAGRRASGGARWRPPRPPRPGRRRARAGAPPCGSASRPRPRAGAADRDAGPARDDLGDVVGVDLLLEEHRRRARSCGARAALRSPARRAASRGSGISP